MALYTKKLILATFREMLSESPFDKITVAALVKRAGISPNTFYYHYQDIYRLLDAWFQEQVESFVPNGEPIEWVSTTKLSCIAARNILRPSIIFLTDSPVTDWRGISSH